MMIESSKLGCFYLSEAWIKEQEEDKWALLLSTFVPLYVEYQEGKKFFYIACSRQFSELMETAKIPEYTFHLNKQEGRYVWKRKSAS